MKTSLQDKTLHLVFEGDIISTNVSDLRPQLLASIETHTEATEVLADLGQATVIDSMGLNLLIAIYRECEKRQKTFRAVNPVPEVRRLLKFLNLAERFRLEPESFEQ